METGEFWEGFSDIEAWSKWEWENGHVGLGAGVGAT